MKPIREVYPEAAESIFGFSVGDYTPLLESFGYTKLLQVDDNDWQGDSRLLYQDGNRYGVLTFGWGSCSGCDALQGCSTYEEVDTLRTNLHNSIIWRDGKTEMLTYMREHDWQGDYNYSPEFIEKAITILEQ